MIDDAFPRKRKNDEYRDSLLSALLRWLGQVFLFGYRNLIEKPLRWGWRDHALLCWAGPGVRTGDVS